MKNSRRKNIIWNFFLALVPTIVFFVSLEVTLRVIHFKYSDMPLEMRTLSSMGNGMIASVIGYNNRDGVIRFVKDSKQLWVPVHSFEEKHSKMKSENVVRIATLGCSCTAGCVGTDETYPGLMEKLLNQKGVPKVEVLNAGVGSYSSFQGLQRLKHVVLKYHPDLITVFFGWNDHWISPSPDSQVKMRSDFEVGLINFMERWRTYQWLHYWAVEIRSFMSGSKTRRQQPQAGITLRVPITEYEKNLNAFVDIAKENKMKILFITAPSDLSNFQPFSNFPFSKENLMFIHASYNEMVRKVARKRSIPLVDLDQIVSRQPADSVISKDGVHFNVSGCQFVANEIVKKIIDSKLLDVSAQ